MAHNILVIRLSAFGDVAMTLPAIYSVAKAYPQHIFYILTPTHFESLFHHQLPNIKTIGIQLKEYEGAKGLYRLSKEIDKGYNIDMVADLHDVLRSQFIRRYFRRRGKRVKYIDKGRAEKRAITSKRKPLRQLTHTIDRYLDVFAKLGIQAEMTFTNYFKSYSLPIENLHSVGFNREKINIGFAPFAMHRGKIYPIEKMERVIEKVSQLDNVQIYLFGGGKEEKQQFEAWEKRFSNAKSLVGQLTLENELLLMSHLAVLVSMDSANMHLASLVETPVISIWGATHPYLGFYGFGQDHNNAIQLDLECRPCSVYGNRPCQRGDYACMHHIKEDTIVEKIKSFVDRQAHH